MAGEVASLLVSRVTVPLLYYMANKKKHAAHATLAADSGQEHATA